MSGYLIRTACEALSLFIRSLPPNSKFNVISFGSKYELMFGSSKVYNNDTMNEALDKIKKFDADFGGTELLPPIKRLLEDKTEYQYPRSVFVLTDGDISEPDKVLKLVEHNNYHIRVHSFGIGSGASVYLVKELAKSGLGSSTLVASGDAQLNTKVIRALKLASKPAFTNLSLSWGDNKDCVKLVTPEAPLIPNLYEEEPFHVYAVLSEEGLRKGELTVSFFNTNTQTDENLSVLLDPASVVSSADCSAFQLAAKRYIEALSKGGNEEQKAKDAEMVELSAKYSVLCDKTAFFGKVKNKNKSAEDMETIRVQINKLKKVSQKDTYRSVKTAPVSKYQSALLFICALS